jgi:hypothetical protein
MTSPGKISLARGTKQWRGPYEHVRDETAVFSDEKPSSPDVWFFHFR